MSSLVKKVCCDFYQAKSAVCLQHGTAEAIQFRQKIRKNPIIYSKKVFFNHFVNKPKCRQSSLIKKVCFDFYQAKSADAQWGK
jgi:hypothetical protein